MDVKQNRKLPVLIVTGLIAVVIIIGIISELINLRTPTKEMADPYEVYVVEEGAVALISNGVLSETQGLWLNDMAYVSLGIVCNELNDHFYWDSTEELLICTTATEIVDADASSVCNGSLVFFVLDTDDEDAEDEDIVYVSLDYVAQYTNIQVDTFTDPNRVFIRSSWGESEQLTVGEDGAALRVEAKIKSPILVNLTAGSTLWVISTEDSWAKVYDSASGYSGYVKLSDSDTVQTVEEDGPYDVPEYTSITSDEPVCLVWHQVFTTSGVDSIESLLASTSGVTVVSPTWFSIVSSDGTIESRANQTYVDTVHAQGMQVWALVENFNTSNTIDNAMLLNTTTSRRALIEALVSEALAYDIDGINVDLESLPSSAGEGYLQFIRELSVYCRQYGLVLSVDNYVPSAWTTHYSREEQSEVIDYLIIMAYDEHYSGSEEAGSTSSLTFVSEGLEDTVEEGVPEEKIINAIPFYSRVWSGEGNSLTSEIISMPDMDTFLAEDGVEVTWLSDLGQYYAWSGSGSSLTQIWIEDAESIEAKLEVMSEYDLAGVACWKLGMETEDVWDVIAAYLAQ